MQSKLHFLALIIIILSCSFCKNHDPSSSNSTPPVYAKAEILKLHHLQRDYHFNKNVNDFVDLLSNDYIAVNRGVISHPSKETNTARFSQYFSSVEFEKWDDIDQPIIRFSQDSTLAYTIVHKQVDVTAKDSTGTETKESVEYAWIAIYRRMGDGWKIECSVSTNKG